MKVDGCSSWIQETDIYAVPNTLYLVSIKQWTFLTRTCLHWYFLTTIERPTWLLPKSEAFNAYPNWQTELCCVSSDIKEGCIIFKDGTFKNFIATLMWKLVFSKKKNNNWRSFKSFHISVYNKNVLCVITKLGNLFVLCFIFFLWKPV